MKSSMLPWLLLPEVPDLRLGLDHRLLRRLDLIGRELVRVDRLAGVDERTDLDDRDGVREGRELPLVRGVEQDVPGFLLRRDRNLVGPVDEGGEPDVEGDVVHETVFAHSRPANRLGDALVVGEQRRVEGLDQAGCVEVRPVGDARMDDIGVVARCHLGERLDVVLEEVELERAPLPVLALGVGLPHPGRGLVVAGPLEERDGPVRLGCGVEADRGRRLTGRCLGLATPTARLPLRHHRRTLRAARRGSSPRSARRILAA